MVALETNIPTVQDIICDALWDMPTRFKPNEWSKAARTTFLLHFKRYA